MPPIVLLIAILLLIAAAVNSLLGALADTRVLGFDRALRDEDPRVPDELLGHAPYGWIHQRLLDAYACEQDGWAVEQVRRIEARLQAGVPPEERLETVILWIPEASAFVMPGRYVYVSRRLVERAMDDEQVAFVIAHEIAHHRLGHVRGLAEMVERVPEPARAIAANVLVARSLVLHGADREADADAHGFNLCLAAGYDGHRCLRALDLMEEIHLDHGDAEGVFGPDAAIEAALDDQPEWMVSLRHWLYERRRGYPSVRERKARLREAYEQALAEAASQARDEPDPQGAATGG
ncbi:MAG TPA: M48 family metalloprotease [Longimicrobium sp.]|nr:M48 family metalloprotease [Longimicrobium sp.]